VWIPSLLRWLSWFHLARQSAMISRSLLLWFCRSGSSCPVSRHNYIYFGGIVIMPTVQAPTSELLSLLGDIVTNDLTTCKVHLAKALLNPIGPNSVLADFTEANYVGYLAQTALFNPPHLNSDGQAVTDSPLLTFQPTANTTPNTIVAFYVTDSASAVYLWGGSFDVPINLVEPTDALPLLLQFILSPPAP
jgi:hypothetical protein